MLDKFLVLLERFVAAHELIAANFAKPAAVELKTVVEGPASEPEQKPVAKRTRAPAKAKAAPEPEQEPEEEEEPAPKAKAKKTKAGPDLDTLREEIKDAALKISTDGTDDCCDDFDDLLDAYKVRNVMKLKDEDIEDFHADLKDLAAKYFELED
jgi:hypothetical protein